MNEPESRRAHIRTAVARRTGTAAVLAVLAIVLAGCGSSGPPRSAPPSVTGTTTLGPTPTAPVATTAPAVTPTAASTTVPTTMPVTTPTGASPPAGFTTAKQQWELGAKSDAAGQAGYWLRAISDLDAVTSPGVPGPTGYATAVQELKGLSTVPETDASAAQQATAQADTLALNSFFDTDGLYGVSAPSYSTAQFGATIQQEFRLGIVDGVASSPEPGATVTCPILTSLASGSDFGCEIRSGASGSSMLVGEMDGTNGTSFFTESGPFRCAALDSGQAAVLHELGGTCT